VELDRKSVHLTHEGFAAAQEAAGVGSFFVGANMEWVHLMEQAMRAHVVYEKDKDYVVERGPSGQLEVVIVDEYTGRKMAGRQWSDGLHQAAEAKERVPVKQETQTMATITLQNFFKMYKALAGMTGTAQTEAEEFDKIYRLEVVTIPTNRKVIRVDNHDRIYRTEREKWDAIVEEIRETSQTGRPVLVGTTSVEKSEMLSDRLTKKYGVKHNVLNAKFHEREAEIVAEAGKQHVNAHEETVGNVTIATNMAGRGTDIKLSPGSLKAGGLHVVGTERHTARRIDNQLRGRAGRQGDPGSSRFYVSLKDDLIKMFAGDWTVNAFKRLGLQEGEAVEDKFINKIIQSAQKKVEERNFLARKNLLEYDEVMEHQRRTFYGLRQRVLIGQEIESVIWNMIGQSITDAVKKYITEDFAAATISEWVRVNLDTQVDANDLHGIHGLDAIEAYIKAQARAEAETNINSTLGEFTGEDANDVKGWDVKGLQSWAMSRFKVSLSMNQLRQSTPAEIEEKLKAAAIEQVNHADCTPLQKYLEPHYAEKELCAWAEDKFRIKITPEELSHPGADRSQLPGSEIADLIEKRAREEYARREIVYPVEHALAFAFGGSQDVSTDNAYGAEYVKAWVGHKFEIDMSAEHIRSTPMHRLREELIGYQEQFLRGGKAEAMADKIVAEHPDAESLREALGARINLKLTARDMQIVATAENPSAPKTLQDLARQRIRAFMRRELTDLEQFVLIQIFDQTWKDHLYAMDVLKTGIGLHAFAERDPRVLFKKEGYAYFRQMMESVRDKVTDLVFRARVVGQVENRNAYRETKAVHETNTGYGVGETVPAAAEQPAGEMQEAAGRTQGEAAKPKPIVRDAPKVGRNDPCPCGSGKKYKKCHGADVV
jgi:preprotein translocase subunit SecA